MWFLPRTQRKTFSKANCKQTWSRLKTPQTKIACANYRSRRQICTTCHVFRRAYKTTKRHSDDFHGKTARRAKLPNPTGSLMHSCYLLWRLQMPLPYAKKLPFSAKLRVIFSKITAPLIRFLTTPALVSKKRRHGTKNHVARDDCDARLNWRTNVSTCG